MDVLRHVDHDTFASVALPGAGRVPPDASQAPVLPGPVLG
jgi:hypothetical protein